MAPKVSRRKCPNFLQYMNHPPRIHKHPSYVWRKRKEFLPWRHFRKSRFSFGLCLLTRAKLTILRNASYILRKFGSGEKNSFLAVDSEMVKIKFVSESKVLQVFWNFNKIN